MTDHAPIDANSRQGLLAFSSSDGATLVAPWADPVTHRLLVDLSGASGGLLTSETPVGTVDDSNVTFTVSHIPIFISVNGGAYAVGTGMFATYSGGTITLAAPVGTGGFITSFYGGGGGSGGGFMTQYSVSGTVDGSNTTFTLAVAPASDILLFLARQLQVKGTDYTLSGSTITMLYAPDSSLSTQPFVAYVTS